MAEPQPLFDYTGYPAGMPDLERGRTGPLLG